MDIYQLPHEPVFCIGGEEAVGWRGGGVISEQLPHEPFFCIGGEEAVG